MSYYVMFARDNRVLLSYSSEGSAKWRAAAIFKLNDGEVYSFTK